MKYALIHNVSWLDELVPLNWANSHELNEAEEPINRLSFNQYLRYPSGKPIPSIINYNGVTKMVTAFSRNGYSIQDSLVNALATEHIELITKAEFIEYLSN